MATENYEGRLSLSTTSPSSPETETSGSPGLVKEWLLRFAANSGQPLDDGRAALWRDEFSRVESALLERAFREVLRVHAFNCIPTVGEIWVQLGEVRHVRTVEEEQVARERWLSSQPSWEELHRRGRVYCDQVSSWAREVAEFQRSRAKKVAETIQLVIVSPERWAELEEQKRIVLSRYPSSELAGRS